MLYQVKTFQGFFFFLSVSHGALGLAQKWTKNGYLGD